MHEYLTDPLFKKTLALGRRPDPRPRDGGRATGTRVTRTRPSACIYPPGTICALTLSKLGSIFRRLRGLLMSQHDAECSPEQCEGNDAEGWSVRRTLVIRRFRQTLVL